MEKKLDFGSVFITRFSSRNEEFTFSFGGNCVVASDDLDSLCECGDNDSHYDNSD